MDAHPPDTNEGQGTVVVGKVTRTHGTRGEVYVRVDSDNPDRFVPPRRFRTSHATYPTLMLRSARPGPHGMIVEFAGVTSIDAASELCGTELSIRADERRQLDVGQFWPDQLVGLEVRDASGRIGFVEEVVLGSQDRLVLADEHGRLGEVPFVSALVPEVHVDDGWLLVDPPEGLFTRR